MMRLPHTSHSLPHSLPHTSAGKSLFLFVLPHTSHSLARVCTHASVCARTYIHTIYLYRTYRTIGQIYDFKYKKTAP